MSNAYIYSRWSATNTYISMGANRNASTNANSNITTIPNNLSNRKVFCNTYPNTKTTANIFWTYYSYRSTTYISYRIIDLLPLWSYNTTTVDINRSLTMRLGEINF